VRPCPKCGNRLANRADTCNGCGWVETPVPPPMGFDALRKVALGEPWKLPPRPWEVEEADEERRAIQAEGTGGQAW
jgi:hypothetical protein